MRAKIYLEYILHLYYICKYISQKSCVFHIHHFYTYSYIQIAYIFRHIRLFMSRVYKKKTICLHGPCVSAYMENIRRRIFSMLIIMSIMLINIMLNQGGHMSRKCQGKKCVRHVHTYIICIHVQCKKYTCQIYFACILSYISFIINIYFKYISHVCICMYIWGIWFSK